jgi:group I intron endonuclease
MTMIIYKITNLINGKIYVGQTIHSLQSRWLRHCRKSSNSVVSKAIRKHGEISFIVEILESCKSEKELDQRERYWISCFNSTVKMFGYNRTNGGQCGGLCGDALNKMKLGVSKALKGRKKPKRTIIQIEKHRQSISGKPNFKKRRAIQCSNGTIYDSLLSASESLGISKGNICSVLKGVRRSAGGFTFGYL